MEWLDIAAELDAAELAADTHRDTRPCHVCGARITAYPDGGARLCLPCTMAELGTTSYILALRVEFGLSQRAVETRLEKYGPPYVSPKEWITPVRKRWH